MTKLTWEFDGDCEVAWHNGYRISAKHDDSPENPFEAWGGNWPIAVRYDGHVHDYDKTKAATGLRNPLWRFADNALVHNQIALANILGRTIRDISVEYDYCDDEEEPANYIWDAAVLRDAFDNALEHDISDGDQFDKMVELYNLLGIPALSATSRGHSQGDWAQVLVVATPEAQAEFGLEVSYLSGLFDAHVAAWWEQQLQCAVDLYSAWAWGDVYGYVVEFAIYDEDGEVEDWEEVPDGSCWGYYGADHAESGLEEQALACVPNEPAPGYSVGSSDNLLEIV